MANTELEIMKNFPAEGSTGERKLLLEQKFKASTLQIHGISKRERRKTPFYHRLMETVISQLCFIDIPEGIAGVLRDSVLKTQLVILMDERVKIQSSSSSSALSR